MTSSRKSFSLTRGTSWPIPSRWFRPVRCLVFALPAILLLLPLRAEVPPVISYQGRVTAEGLPFTGAGSFKFSLIRAATGLSVWSNDGTHPDGTEPDGPVPLAVANGLFTALLGDAAVMTAFPVGLFEDQTDLQLRVWFSDGAHGFEQLLPDTRLASVHVSVLTIDTAEAGG